jgi:hypothetical protein
LHIINLHEESNQLVHSMANPELSLPLTLQPSCTNIVDNFHEASTLAELRLLFLWGSAAQEVFIDLVGYYLDEVVRSNDQCLVRTAPSLTHFFLSERPADFDS